MRALAVSALCLLAACGPPAPPTMEAGEAEALLTSFSRGGQPVDPCTTDGQLQLRAAVRAHGRAMAAEGKVWPDFAGVIEGPDTGELPMLDIAVAGAVATGLVYPDDLPPETGALARMMILATGRGPGVEDARTAMRVACPDMLDLHQAMAQMQLESERVQRTLERARERGDDRRVRDITMRAGERAMRSRAQIEALIANIDAKVRRANADQGV